MSVMNSSKKFTILNVDDNDAGRYAKSRSLQRAGYHIVEAATGASALQLVREIQPELVLLDIRLPDINGQEVCRIIKNDPVTAATMVLQISAFEVTATDRIRSLENGADGCLTEPIGPDELIATSRALLRLHERERENRRLLAELAASEAHFRASFESTSVGMVQAEPFTGRLLRVNRRFCEIIGYVETDLIGRPFADFTHPEDREDNFATFLTLSRGEVDHYRVEKRYIRKSGDIVWVDVTVNRVCAADGTSFHSLAVVQDITQRKQAEAAQRETDQRFRELANLMPQIVFSAAPDGQLEFLNNQWGEFTGDAEKRAIVDGWDGFLHPEDIEPVQRCWRASMERGAPYELEFRLRGRDGLYRWLLNRTVPMKDEQGQVSKWIGTWTDIDSSKRLHDALLESEERLRLAIEAAHFGTYDVDVAKDEIYCSPELRAICGLSGSAPLSIDAALNLIHSDDRAAILDRILGPLRTGSGGECEAEFRVVRSDGEVRWVILRGRGYFAEHGDRPLLLRGLGTVTDITARKYAEEQLRLQNDRLQLLAKTAEQLLVAGDPSVMMREVFAAVQHHLGLDGYVSHSIDESGNALVLEASAGIPAELATAYERLSFAQAICGTVAQSRTPRLVERLQDSVDPNAALEKQAGFRAYVCHPLLVADRLLGTLSFGSKHRDSFEPDEIESMRTICHYVAMAKERLRLLEQARAQAEHLAKNELRLQLSLDTADVGIYEWQLQTVQAIWDDRLRAHWGVRPGAPITYDMFMQGIHPEDRAMAQAAMEPALDPASEGRFDVEFRVIGRDDGVERWIATRGQVFYENDRPVRLLGTTFDRTERKRSEVARAQLAAIVETSDDAIISTDLSGIITSWNRGAERLYGYSAAAIIGRPVSVLVPQERHDEEQAIFHRIRQGEAIENYETKRRRQDGGHIDVSLTISAIRDDRGRIIGASKIARDISARIIAEETLWRSEEQLRLAQTAAHVGIWDWEPGSNRLSWTAEMLNLYGVSLSLQSYDEWRKLVHADDLARIEAERGEALHNRQDFNVEYRIMHGSGEIRWISSRGQGWYGEDGKLLRVLGINMDVTERKRAEADVRESERRFRALADSAPVLIWINGPEGAQFCNQAYRDFVGVSDDAELTGSRWANYLHPDDRDGYMSAYSRAVENREPFEGDFRMRRADGEYRWMKSQAMPRAGDAGSTLIYAGCTIDIHDAKLAEAQLALLAAVVNSSQDAIYSFTLDTKIVSWNLAAEALFGWTEAEMLGQKWTLFVPPELSDELDGIVAMVQNGQVITGFETKRLRKDGSRFDVALAFSPVVAQDKIIAISAIARDITERKVADDQRDQQARLLDLSLDAIIVWSSPDRTIEYWNQGAEKLYGYTAGEVYGRPIHEVLKTVFPISQPEIEAKIYQEGEWDGRLLHTQKTGGRVAVLSRMQRISRPKGNVVLEVNRDITVIEEAEQAVAEAAAHLNAIVETAVDGIITIDERGVIDSFNPAAEKVFGYAAADITGKEITLLMPEWAPNRGADVTDNLKKVGQRGSGQETYGRRSDGSQFPVDFGISETVMGEARFYTALVRDATARKEAEQALIEAKNAADAANRAKSEFLANMSHEIRNPMTGIMGYADILLERLQDKGAIECVRTIKDSGQYLLQIINDLLDLAKIEAQGLQLEKEDIHLPTFLTDVYTLMEGAARAKGLPLSLKYDGVIPYEIESDPKRVRQILINLLGNAIKFTDRGGVELSVYFDSAQAELQFRVSDSGIGMTQEQQQNLFKPFAQGDSSMTKTYGGTGLGLAITKRLVEALGGRIGVDSVSGRGSTFHVTVPVRVLSGGAYRDIEMAARAPALSRQKQLNARVMIVEDQPDIRRLMEYFIAAAGGVVSAFSSGEGALAAVQQQPNDFDVILMDIQMPRMDGYETTRQLRALGFTKPIIAVTAGAMAGDRANCFAAGCSDYVSKPIDMTDLLDKIAGVASTRQLIAEQEHWREPGLWEDVKSNGSQLHESNAGDSQPEQRRVLVVDDRPVALNATKSLLELHGFDVRTAATGHAAIRIASEFRPHYVFLDISLPDISGYEVLRRLKASELLAHSKFIALSGHGREESLRAHKAGFDAYLTKPVDIREMKKIISGATQGPAERQ